MTWTKYISKRYNVPYWHNSKTNKSVWVKPEDFIESIPVSKKFINTKEVTSNSVQVSNNNGRSFNIEGQSHWTSEDYREALRDLNQAMREF